MSEIEIREMTLNDYDAVYDLWKHSEGVGLSSADSREAIGRFLAHNPGLCFTAWQDGGLVGAVMCGFDGRRGYLHHLAVANHARRQGIGQALSDRCLQALKALGVSKCHIFVYGSNQSGQAFWSAAGWKLREELVIMSHDIV